MTPQKLPNDIAYIRHFYRYLNIFLITPWYDFNSNTFYKPSLRKLYACFLISLKVAWLLNFFFSESVHTTMKSLLLSQKLLVFFSTMNLVALSLVTIVKTSFLDPPKWKAVIDKFLYIDAKLQVIDRQEIHLKWYYFRYFVKQVVFFAIFVYAFVVWTKSLGRSVIECLPMIAVSDYFYEYLSVMYLAEFIGCVRRRYQSMREKIERCHRKPGIVLELENLIDCYRTLGETVDLYNEIFGYQIILIIFHCGVESLHCLNFAYVFMVAPEKSSLLYHILAVDSLLLLQVLVCQKQVKTQILSLLVCSPIFGCW